MNKTQLIINEGAPFPYNVQILTEVTPGEGFFYCGNGKSFKTMKEAQAYIKQIEGANNGGRPRKELLIDQEPSNGKYFTVEEVTLILGVHRRTVQARLRDGTLKGKKLHGSWKIYKDSLKGM